MKQRVFLLGYLYFPVYMEGDKTEKLKETNWSEYMKAMNSKRTDKKGGKSRSLITAYTRSLGTFSPLVCFSL